MSAAAAAATPTTADAPAPKGKKKLLVIIIAVVAVLAIAGVGALLLLKKSHGADDEDADTGHAKAEVSKARDPKHPPVFSPLDPFTVNLADKEAERYAQIGITLELDEAATADALKVFMPAVRNNVLMLLAHKTSTELMERDGKEALAKEVAREVSRGLGVDVGPDEGQETSSKKRKKRAEIPLPVVAVYFSTFIIQ
jgi:flagellar FliL protein